MLTNVIPGTIGNHKAISPGNIIFVFLCWNKQVAESVIWKSGANCEENFVSSPSETSSKVRRSPLRDPNYQVSHFIR